MTRYHISPKSNGNKTDTVKKMRKKSSILKQNRDTTTPDQFMHNRQTKTPWYQNRASRTLNLLRTTKDTIKKRMQCIIHYTKPMGHRKAHTLGTISLSMFTLAQIMHYTAQLNEQQRYDEQKQKIQAQQHKNNTKQTPQQHPSGFTLIELAIAITIGSLLLTVLYQGFSAIQTNYRASSARTNSLALQAPIIELISNDVASCCALEIREKKQDKKEKNNQKQPTTQPLSESTQSKEKEKKEEKQKKHTPFLLFGDSKQTRLLVITTTNAFTSYNRVIPFPQRVIYQRTTKNSLVRYHSSDYTSPIENEKQALDLIAKQKLEPLTLFEGVTDWHIETVVAGDEKKKNEPIQRSAWGPENKETTRRMPDGCIWHITYKTTAKTYELLFATPLLTSEQKTITVQQVTQPGATNKTTENKKKQSDLKVHSANQPKRSARIFNVKAPTLKTLQGQQ